MNGSAAVITAAADQNHFMSSNMDMGIMTTIEWINFEIRQSSSPVSCTCSTEALSEVDINLTFAYKSQYKGQNDKWRISNFVQSNSMKIS